MKTGFKKQTSCMIKQGNRTPEIIETGGSLKMKNALEKRYIMRKGFIKNSLSGNKLIYRSSPRMFFIHIIFTTCHGLSWALQVMFMQKFFDVATQFTKKEVDYGVVILYLAIMVLTYAFCQLMNGVDNCHARLVSLNLSKCTNQLIFENIDRLNIIDFEDTNRLDTINKAVNGSNNVAWISITLMDIIFFYVTYFIFMGWYLFTLKPILGVCILIIFIPCIISKIVQTKAFENLENKIAPIRRECDYYEGCIKDIQETRLLGATNLFLRMFERRIKELNHIVFMAQMRKSVINFILNIITVVGYGVIIYMLFIFVMKQEITIGAFAAVLTSIYRLYDFMNEVVSQRIGWAYENLAAVQNFFDFINEDRDENSLLSREPNQHITIKDVNFSYPSSEKKVLNNINFTIHKGETIAIVGENGSGKSTLCKLILGLYNPLSGEILYGDKPIDTFNYDNTSAIFQNYCCYKMTLEENITISQIDKIYDQPMIYDICSKSSVILEDYKSGLNTMIGRDFDGVEISKGQWQRIGIARGLFRDSDFIVLDEPTAAIDPIQETELYNDFSKICSSKTAIIVTHRLGSAKIADRIIVMKNGEIVQYGNHYQLISVEGEYKNMFESQSKWYAN